MVRQGVNITCLLTYLSEQLGAQEKLTLAELMERGHVEMSDVPMADFSRLATPQEMLEDILSMNKWRASDPSSSVSVARMAMSAYLADLNISNTLGNVSFPSYKLRELKELADATDYSKMSDTQKVMTIYGRYEEAFGNFLNVGYIQYSGSNGLSDSRSRAVSQFKRELIDAFGSLEKAQEAYRFAQYGNMSNADIRASIVANYPPVGEMTLRDFNFMLQDMVHLGVDDGLAHAFGAALEISGLNSIAREELMDTPLDINWLCDGYNFLLNDAIQRDRTIELGTNRVLLQLFGVQLDRNGNASSNIRTPVNYTSQARILSSKYNSWSAQDFEKLLLAEFSKGYEERVAEHEKRLEQMRTPPEPEQVRIVLPYWMQL